MTVDTIYNSFSEYPITPLKGLPTIDYLRTMWVYLNEETSNIQSKLGNGNLGHMVITAIPAMFALQFPVGYVLPVNPGPIAIIPASSTGPQISVLNTDHDGNIRIWRLKNVAEKACKKVISILIPERFYCTLKIDTHNSQISIRPQSSPTCSRNMVNCWTKPSKTTIHKWNKT